MPTLAEHMTEAKMMMLDDGTIIVGVEYGREPLPKYDTEKSKEDE